MPQFGNFGFLESNRKLYWRDDVTYSLILNYGAYYRQGSGQCFTARFSGWGDEDRRTDHSEDGVIIRYAAVQGIRVPAAAACEDSSHSRAIVGYTAIRSIKKTVIISLP